MKHHFLLSYVLLIAVWLSLGGCRSTNIFCINADQTVSVNVKDMPITAFVDLVNETYRQSKVEVFPWIHVQPEWHPRNRKTNINSEPLISVNFHRTSISNVVDILITQYADVISEVGSPRRFDPNRIPLSQGGGKFVQWTDDLLRLDEMALIDKSAELLNAALGPSVNVRIEILPRQLEASSLESLTADLSPMTVNDYVQLIEFAFPVRFDFTNECVVIRFDETWPKKANFPTHINKQPSFFETPKPSGTREITNKK